MDTAYLLGLTNKLFKILPLREEGNNETYLPYIDSLWIEMSGACYTFPHLWEDVDYVAVLNIVGYLNMHEVTVKRCRREVFKAIDLIKKVQSRNGGDAIE